MVSRCRPNVRAVSRMLIPSTITARRTRRYTSTLYIHRTIHGVGYNPMNDGGRYSIQSPILSNLPPARSTLSPPFTRVDGALTVPPRVQTAPPARRRAHGDGQRVPAGPDVGRGWPVGAGRHWPPGGGRQKRCGYGRDCCVAASIGCFLFPGGFLFQNHYPRFRGAPSGFLKGCPQGCPSVDSGLVLAPTTLQ